LQPNPSESSQNIKKTGHSATFKVQNSVISVNFDHQIPLDEIRKHYRDIEYNSQKFPGICIRLTPPTPKSTVLLFHNGKAIITGLKNTKDIPKVIAKIVYKLNRIGIHVTSKPKYELANIVASIDFKCRINLDIASLVLDSSIYEPEIFPGLIYRVYSPKAVFLIFSSGKVILTGVKSENCLIPLIKQLGTTLKAQNLL